MSGIAGLFSKKAVDMLKLKNSWQGAVEEMALLKGEEFCAVCLRPNGIFLRFHQCSQPERKPPFMEFASGSETYAIVYDGHLINAQELRCRLVKAGLNFVSQEEGEVVLKAYLYWGELCVHYLNGSFSFAVYEENAGKVFAARDPLGRKPFYYAETAEGFLFASQIRLLFASGLVKPVIGEEGFYSLFFLSPAYVQGAAVYQNIFELPMGHMLQYQNGGLKIKQYWKPAAQIHEETLDETISHTRYFMREALRRQLGVEEPLCVLSPGSLGAEIISQTIADLSFLKGGSCLSYPVCLTNKNGVALSADLEGQLIIPWREQLAEPEKGQRVSPDSYIAGLRAFAKRADLPGMGGQDALQTLFYEGVRPYSFTAFAPLGIDEFFGGHPWYCNRDMLFDSIFPWCRSVPLRSGMIQERYLGKSRDYIFGAYESMVTKMDTLPGEKALEQRMREVFILNLYWYLPAFFRQAETLERLTGVETRAPFCDRRLVEYAYNIPWSMKALDGLEKGVLRKAAEGILPQKAAWKPQANDREDGNTFFYDALKREMERILEEPYNVLNAFFNQNHLLALLAQSEGDSKLCAASKPQICRLLAWLIQLDEWLKTNGAVFEL